MIKKLYDHFERNHLIGRKRYQKIFESLHRFSLRGMNYGQNHSVDDNGEMWVMQHLYKKAQKESVIKPIIFDIGANKGQYLRQLKKVFTTATAYSFEPSPFAFKILNQEAQKLKDVYCFQLGIGDRETTLPLRYATEGSVLASFSPLAFEKGNEKQSEANITTINSFCKAHNIEEIYLLKLDVEGYELNALKGASQIINNNKIKYIQFEFGKNNIQQGIFLKDFFNILHKYRIYRILKDGLYEIPDYELRREIFLTTNYLAELK